MAERGSERFEATIELEMTGWMLGRLDLEVGWRQGGRRERSYVEYISS